MDPQEGQKVSRDTTFAESIEGPKNGQLINQHPVG